MELCNDYMDGSLRSAVEFVTGFTYATLYVACELDSNESFGEVLVLRSVHG